MATNTKINGQDYYRIRRTIGHKADGSPIVKNFYGTSKGDAEQQYKLYLEEEARKKYDSELALSTATFHSRADEYITNVLRVSSTYAPSTRRRYESSYRTHIENTWLDKMLIRDLTPMTIQKFYNELNVTMPTMDNLHKYMAAQNKWMVLNGYSTDLLSAITIPEKPHTPRHDDIVVWEQKEIDAILSHSGGHRQRFLYFLLTYTGMRIGEALGLKYGDIRDGLIYVDRQLNEGTLKAPKYNSSREIPIHPKVAEALKIHKAWHEAEMAENGYTTDFIFTSKSGKLLDIGNYRRAAMRYYQKIGVPLNGFHTYRSTFCTNLCRANVPLEVARKLLGHKSIEVTAKHYALIKKDSKIDAINKLQ